MQQPPRETDVFVAGGGPAGLAAAIACCQNGLRVVVVDVCRPPIEKSCGEGLMPDAVAALRRLGVRISPGAHSPFRGVRFHDAGVSAEANLPNRNGLGVRRRALHEALVSRAGEAGAALVWGARVNRISEQGALVDGHLVRCRWIVGAEGENSAIRRWSGLHDAT